MTVVPHFVPEDSRVYAVGDIHGRLDLLEEIQGRIMDDAALAGESRKVVVYLGDYVDRGPDSRGVVEHLCRRPMPGFESVHLLGNHEAMMLAYLDDVAAGPGWFYNGGTATLASYGVDAPMLMLDRTALAEVQAAFKKALPEQHLAFLTGLTLMHREDDYVFVHAGIRPGVPLEEQSPEDLVWIREEFLYSLEDHGFRVVHGHTPTEYPVVTANRIGIDTGAVFTGRLTCLVLTANQAAMLLS